MYPYRLYIITRFILLLLFSSTLDLFCAQDAVEIFKLGMKRHDANDCPKAIELYTKAINLDSTLARAYFNRGTCHLKIGKPDLAEQDFLLTITYDSLLMDAYYSYTVSLLYANKHKQALPMLNKALLIEPNNAPLRNLRGQIYAYLGDKQSACNDLSITKGAGDKEGNGLFDKICGGDTLKGEAFSLPWPVDEHWRVQNISEDSTFSLMEFFHDNEQPELWTEYGAMMTLRDIRNANFKEFSQMIYQDFKQRAPKATLQYIKEDKKSEFPWLILSLQAPSTVDHQQPESQLWYIIQGKTALYSNFRAVKKATLSKELIKKWSAFFRSGTIIEK